MTIQPNQTYTIKIANGDEIVTRITAESDISYMISRPLVVVPSPQGIQMIFGMFTADPEKPVELNKSAVSMIAPSRQEVCDSYTEATTGIKPVTNKILMG
jgi:hypothetical protein